METNSNNWNQPVNDGENQGHHWERHHEDKDVRYAMDKQGEGEEEEIESADWGDVDPQHDPLIPPGPMDPSGPGSAV